MTDKQPKPKSSDWHNLPLDRWNTSTFHAYLIDKHAEMFGVEYVPYRGWQAEKGLIGGLIGTRTKEAKYSAATIKRFIDECMAEYRPTTKYPGINFGWMWTYKSSVFQRVLAEELAEKRRKEADEQASDFKADDVRGWL